MRWHYNTSQNTDPLIRDLWAGATFVAGQACAISPGANGTLLAEAATVPIDVVGVSLEAATTSTLASGTIVNIKVIVNPDAVYLAEQDLAAANDIDATAGATTTITVGASDDNLDGSWVYLNSGTGAGQLAFVGAATTTVLTYDTSKTLTAGDATTDVVILRKKWDVTGGRDLDSTVTMLATDEDETGDILVLENYIQSSTIPFEPLHPSKHHALSGLNATGQNLKLYSDIHFQDHVLLTNTV